jgi:hypothetical protein
VRYGGDVWWLLPKLKVIDTKTVFNAVDGLHHASVSNDEIVS